jgi:hypothetical protein
MLEIPRYSPRAVCASRRSIARVLSPKCIFGDIIVKLGNVERRAAALFHARRATAAQNRLEAKSSHGRQIVKERRGQWAVKTRRSPLLHSLLAPRCSQPPSICTSVYCYGSIVGEPARQKLVAKFRKFSAAQVVAARGDRDLRGPRIWRAGGKWHFGESIPALRVAVRAERVGVLERLLFF